MSFVFKCPGLLKPVTEVADAVIESKPLKKIRFILSYRLWWKVCEFKLMMAFLHKLKSFHISMEKAVDENNEKI